MSANNKIGVKCLNNLHLRVLEKGMLEEISNEDVEEEKSDEDKDTGEEKNRIKEKKKRISRLFPLSQMMTEIVSQEEQEESKSKGETSNEEEGEDPDDHISSDEEVRMPTKKEPLVKQRKSIRLGSKRRLAYKWKRLVISLDDDDDSSTHTSSDPKQKTPPSPKPDVPPSPHIPLPSPSAIPCTPSPTTTPNSPGLGFTSFANPSVFADPIIGKL